MSPSSIKEYVQDTISRIQRNDRKIRRSGLKIVNPNCGGELRHFADTNNDTLSSDDIVKILDTARLCGPSITVLSLEYLELDSRVCMALLQLLQCDNRQWESVTIQHCNGSTLEASLGFIASQGNVEIPSHSQKIFSPSRFCSVAMILASNPTNLSTLEVVNYISGDAARALSQGLQMNTTLKTLELSWCEFHDESLYFLSEGIARHPFLEELKFIGCQLSDEECALVMNAISDNLSIRYIDFRSNFCGSRTMEATAACLQDNRMPNLETLIFHNEDLAWHHDWQPLPVGVLGASLKNNTSLHHLNFSFNPLQTDELEEFMDGLRHSCVTNLCLFGCRLTNEQLEIILSILPDCLKCLNITAGDYSNDTAGALILDSLQRHKHIETLFMDETMPCWEQAYYLLRLNRGGRFILSHKIPFSLWPIILARVNTIGWPPTHKEYDWGYREDVLYYFLKAIAPNIGKY